MNQPDGAGRGETSVLTAVLGAAGEIQRRLDAAVDAHGLSLSKLGVLEALVARGGTLSLGQVASALQCVRSNVTQLMDRLEAEGLVRRAADPGDRRGTLAVITEEGRRRYEAASRAKSAAEEALLLALPEGSRGELVQLLEALRRQAP
jgi:DNA-binding MarR family transcriptional regulator